jgi:hypothetical protein
MRTFKRFRRWRQANPLYGEQLRAWARLLFLLVSIPIFGMVGMWVFESADPFKIAENIRGMSIWAKLIPRPVALLLTPFTAWNYARYLLAPLGAFLLVFLAGVLYVQDIYALESFSSALRYVFSSMFGLTYPRLQIDGGKKKLRPGEINTLDKIGGPGFALVQPGNAVIFKKLLSPSIICLPRRYFMTPFETIGPIADLTDQEGYKDEIWTVTLDGIQLHLRDIRFCYRLLPAVPRGNGPVRAPQTPYPFSEDTLLDSVFNLSAGDTWQTAVERMVVGEITGFINKYPIDHLTAPRRFSQDPRRELRTQLFKPGIQKRLKNIGAELLWVDIGHMDIVELSPDKHENVDGQRLDYWASRWIGEIKKTHAIGEAKRTAYQERGRVDAQADFLKSITESLRGIEQTEDPAENLRRLLLVRTAEILEGMAEAHGKKENRHD